MRPNTTTRITLGLGGTAALLVLSTLFSVTGCGSGGGGGGGQAGTAAAGSSAAGSASPGAAGTGGPDVAGSGAAGSGAAGTGAAGTGAAGTGDPIGVACEPKSSFALAIHIVVNVSWEATLGANAGTGAFHLWNLARMTANGTALTGTTQACGSTLPTATLKPLVGGGMALVEVPDAAWDLPSAPKFQTVGTLAAWTTGSALMTAPTIALVGLTMADPEAAWPDSYTMITAVDVDADNNPGITGIPKSGGGYVQTPVGTPIAGFGPRADKIFLVSRTGVGLNGTLTSCTEQSGTVTVKFFDNHVVGCHVSGGDACTPTQTNFVDMYRTKYTILGATFTSKFVADDANCAAARAI